MRLLVKVLQAVLIVLSLMMMIFLVLDGFNPTMNFLRNGITKGLLWAFSLLALADGLLVMASVITGRFRTGKKKHKHPAHGEE
jgi:choline-glycine betaine transporter